MKKLRPIVRRPAARETRVLVRHAAGWVLVVCAGCGNAGPLEEDLESLSAAAVAHAKGCRVAHALSVCDRKPARGYARGPYRLAIPARVAA